MKLKSLVTFACLFVIVGLKAQINIQFNGINEYAFNTAQAMNLTVINANPKAFEVQFSGKITSGNGSLVVEFKSNTVMLNPGANMLNPMNPGIHEQIYHNSDIAEIEAKTGTYPSSNYTICIWSACTQPDCQGAGQGSGSIETPVCTQVHVENPTSLLLASPGNGSEIEETRPLYTWIPPAPVAGSASLNYTMTLVEILEGQSISDALTLNRPLIDMTGIGNPMLMYPSDLAALESGKSYAWQVQAYIGTTPIAKSEQWKFRVRKEPKKIEPMQAVFLRTKNDQYLYDVHSDSMYLGIKKTPVSVRQEGSVSFFVKDHTGKIIKETTIHIQEVGNSSDYLLLRIPMNLVVPQLQSGTYILELKDVNIDEKFLRFRIL